MLNSHEPNHAYIISHQSMLTPTTHHFPSIIAHTNNPLFPTNQYSNPNNPSFPTNQYSPKQPIISHQSMLTPTTHYFPPISTQTQTTHHFPPISTHPNNPSLTNIDTIVFSIHINATISSSKTDQ